MDSRLMASGSSGSRLIKFLGDSVDSRPKTLVMLSRKRKRFWGIVWTAGVAVLLALIWTLSFLGDSVDSRLI